MLKLIGIYGTITGIVLASAFTMTWRSERTTAAMGWSSAI